MTGREVAWRVLAQEYLASVEEERGEGDKMASYLLSPLGARMNRVLMVGTLGPAEPVGQDPAQPFWRARLVDATGTVTVTAGSYQPRALTAIQGFRTSQPALVVGKAQLFRGRDGSATPTLRAEEIRSLVAGERRELEIEAVASTLDRIGLVQRLRRDPGPGVAPTPGDLTTAVSAARTAIEKYPHSDPERFRESLLPLVVPGDPRATPASAVPPPTKVVRRVDPAPAPTLPRAHHAQESLLLDLLDELSEASEDGYADLKEALSRAAARGLSEVRVEELLGRLEEDGVLEEPIVGKVRRA